MIIINKRGLSDIVTNVLIILLVLVAVSIIWLFLSPTIRQGAAGVGGAEDCITLSIEPVSCSGTGGSRVVVAKRNAGSGDLKDLQFLFIKTSLVNGEITTTKGTETGTQVLNELESRPFTVTGVPSITLGSETLQVSIAPIVDDGQGGNKVCAASSVKVTC